VKSEVKSLVQSGEKFKQAIVYRSDLSLSIASLVKYSTHCTDQLIRKVQNERVKNEAAYLWLKAWFVLNSPKEITSTKSDSKLSEMKHEAARLGVPTHLVTISRPQQVSGVNEATKAILVVGPARESVIDNIISI